MSGLSTLEVPPGQVRADAVEMMQLTADAVFSETVSGLSTLEVPPGQVRADAQSPYL